MEAYEEMVKMRGVSLNRRGRRRQRLALLTPILMIGPGFGPLYHPRNGGSSRKQAEEDPGLKFYFNRSADPMLVLNTQHVIVDANPAATTFFARPIEALRDAPALDIDMLARLLTAGSILQRARTDPPPIVDEVSVSDAEGQPRQCRVQAIPLDEDRLLLQFQDTTPVLKARGALRAAEQLHHAMLEALPAVAWTMALPEERLLEVSPAVERMFGYQPAAFRTHPELWSDLVHPADRERVRSEFRRGIATGRSFEIEFTGLHREHHDLPHLVNRIVPVADDRGWIDRCEGFIEDRSAQRLLESTLHTTEAHLRHTLEAVSSGVLVLKPDDQGMRVVLCNRRFASLLRLDEPVRPGTLLSSAPPEVRQLLEGGESEIDRRARSEDTWDEIVELTDPHRVLRRYSAPVRDVLGRVSGRIVSIEDVTSTWLMRRRLTHAQKMESMTRLAGGVAHDFNNLLGAIGGFASMIADATPANDPRREPLDQILKYTERATRLTQALLTFSRSARFERMPVDVNRVIDDSYHLLRTALDPGVTIELDLGVGLPPVMGDAVLLQQLVVHVVQEAGLHLHSGSTLRISTNVESGADTTTGARHVMLTVEAHEDSVAPTVPDPLTSSDEPPGLALTIAEDLARVHGGHFVSERAERGHRYRVGLPMSTTDEPPLLTPDEAMARGRENILVVDDEQGLLTIAKTGLQQRGFHVLTAENGEQALEILRGGNTRVDLVVLDLSMPGLSGERVLRTLRGFAPELPVVIASGYATVESQRAWTAAGAQGFVAKPYRLSDLATKVREVLDRSHGRVP
jgi:nitrogen-specific signal transduction histidine kinase/ActR/RegA family two-component response regulator